MSTQDTSPEAATETAETTEGVQQTDNLESGDSVLGNQNNTETNNNETNRVSSQESQPDDSSSENSDQTENDPFESFRDLDGNIDTDKLSNSYLELRKQFSRDKNNVPEAPESADEYEYEPQAIDLDEDASKEFKQKAHELGLSNEQYQALMEQYENEVSKMLPDPNKAEQTLKEQWGDKFDSNLQAANKAISEYADVDITQYPHLANDPVFADIMAKIGSELGEDSAPATQNASSGPAPSESRLYELMDTKAYWDGGHPEHHKVMSEAMAIRQRLYDE